MSAAKPRKPKLAIIGIALVLYATGLWIAINFGHYANLAQRRGYDLGPHRWKPHTAEACFMVGTLILAAPALRRLTRRAYSEAD